MIGKRIPEQEAIVDSDQIEEYIRLLERKIIYYNK